MDERAAKLALARKKLKDHQVKKTVIAETGESARKKEDLHIPTEQTMLEIKPDTQSDVNNTTTLYEQEPNISVNEILNAKKNLETELGSLQFKISQLDYDKNVAVNECSNAHQEILKLKSELGEFNNKLVMAEQEILLKNNVIRDLQEMKTSLGLANSNLGEQLDFTKSLLTSKESECISLNNQVLDLQNRLEVMEVQLQQLTHGAHTSVSDSNNNKEIEQLNIKNTNLLQLTKKLEKERDQINAHYEHYVAELNQQLNSLLIKNDALSKEVERLSIRESSLIEQISEMEIRVQNYKIRIDEQVHNNQSFKTDCGELQQNYEKTLAELQQLTFKYDALQKQFLASEAKIIELSQTKKEDLNSENHDSISLTKLNADMTSDKIAAQRATEQNKKLKVDIQELEEAFVKMSQDKLDLTEKLAAEKYLNRELTKKLAEIDEKAKDMHVKLYAKDTEMIRLQANYKSMEDQFNAISQQLSQKENNDTKTLENLEHGSTTQNNVCQHYETDKVTGMPTEDAMMKLQERFLKIMDDVADLSDEKHRLEHIILQLQNETDTICEYVALYQQQRSLLRKRDEERSAQMKIFQNECDKLKAQLEDLTGILKRFAEDKELSSYFKTDNRENEISKVIWLLQNLKQSSIINPHKNNLDFHSFYPCSCCSGKLIEV